jgi:hypothetical protein
MIGGMRKGRGRPRKEVPLDFMAPPRMMQIPLGPALTTYGPKRRRGRPNKPVDYVTNYIPPFSLSAVGPIAKKKAGRPRKRPYGPKRKIGRPRKQTVNTELEAAIQQELTNGPFFF